MGQPGKTLLFSPRRRISQLALILLLIAQVGLVAHRLEHYLAPSIVDCDEDSCAAFAPVTDPPPVAALTRPPESVVYFVRFWTAHSIFVEQPAGRLGFRAQAPPPLQLDVLRTVV